MKFSIIIPVYNTEQYIESCIKSVLNQTNENFECIIVDDGSNDNSMQIVKKVTKGDSRFKIIHQDNKGLSAARNTGMKNSQGDYLVFLDSDDWFLNNALEILGTILENDDYDVIANNTYAYYFDGTNKLILLRSKNCKINGLNLFLECCNSSKYYYAAWTFVIRRKYQTDSGIWFKEGLLHEDELWVPQILLESDKVYFNSVGYYCGRCDRLESITQKKNIRKLEHKLKIIDSLIDYSETKSNDVKEAVLIRNAMILTGVIKQSNLYINDLQYTELLVDIENHLQSLKVKQKKYNILFWGCKFFGVKFMSKVMNKLAGL